MFRLWFYLVFILGGFFSTAVQAQTNYSFVSTYQEWINPNNQFIDYFDDQARVVFIGSAAYSKNGDGTRPTVSEGMGYGLLLAYANNDQTTFDKFLRYIIGVANNQGCSVFTGQECLAPCPFLMPWVVNEQGVPFWYLPNASSTTSYYSSGSASDADMQIAWALYLASENVKKGSWANSTFSTVKGVLTYRQIFEIMALQIRLNDVDLRKLRYTPGNQWGASGKKLIYPGYFTPQAFLALDKAPLPNISTSCPNPYPTNSPINSLKLVFKNNATKTVSIDYLGGNGGLQVDANFVPKPADPNGYTVGALEEATAIFTSDNQYYANATIQATHYAPNGFATITSNYYIEYNNNVWTVTDKGSTPKQSTYCQSPAGNVVYVFLTQPGINRITFKFSQVLDNSIKAILKNQMSYVRPYKNALLPNVIYYNGTFPDDNFSYYFGFDSCRFGLWTGGFLQSNPGYNNPLIRISLALLLRKTGIANFIQNNTLPAQGINILTDQPFGDWSNPAIPLNATMMTGAAALGYTKIFNALSPPVLAYQLVNNQPSVNDPEGDSGPYYNAAMVLLSEAILNKKL